ncbi:MAG: hypothetical protein AAGF24_16110, partial [Cyanobacteria bacterium P01_H01_bin.121]
AIHVKASSQIVPAHGNTVKTQHTSGRIDWRGTVRVHQTAGTANRPSLTVSRFTPSPSNTNPTESSRLGTSPHNHSRLNGSRSGTSTWVAPDGVEIPVIQPNPTPLSQSLSAASSNLDSTSSTRESTSAIPPPPTNLLGVPDLPIPLGRTELPTVAVEQTPWNRGATASIRPQGLRYRVVVAATDPQQQSRLKVIVPSAFRTRVNGQVVMQAGAFRDLTEAQQLQQQLLNQGLAAELIDL